MDEELLEHLRNAPPEEAERLEATLSALRAVPDEEIPRRIAFVSDKVFEPKWWQRFPVWGLASAAMLSCAILAHGYLDRPQPAVTQTAVNVDALKAEMRAEMAKTVAKLQAENDARLKAAVTQTEQRLEFAHRATMVSVQENFDLMRKQMSRWYMASAETGAQE